MASMKKRAYLLTFNNPAEHGMTHEAIKEILAEKFKLRYYCMADEIGLETKTPHTHLYMYAVNQIRFITLHKAFPSAHIDQCFGLPSENYAYVTKSGKYADSDKHDTSIEGTFDEWGEIPNDRDDENHQVTQADQIFEMIKEGASDLDIITAFPSSYTKIADFDRVRQILRYEYMKTTYRDMTVTYRYGDPGVGKTRKIMEQYGYDNVYRITDYSHPFDGYRGQQTVLFDEFRSSLPIADMLKYLEGYPLELPCRFHNKVAVFQTVYIVSNIPLGLQYSRVQSDEPVTYKAFCRRIHTIQKVAKDGSIREIDDALAAAGFDVDVDYKNPFI